MIRVVDIFFFHVKWENIDHLWTRNPSIKYHLKVCMHCIIIFWNMLFWFHYMHIISLIYVAFLLNIVNIKYIHTLNSWHKILEVNITVYLLATLLFFFKFSSRANIFTSGWFTLQYACVSCSVIFDTSNILLVRTLSLWTHSDVADAQSDNSRNNRKCEAKHDTCVTLVSVMPLECRIASMVEHHPPANLA